MPKACVYENEKGKTEYCPICNHDDVPYCQYLDDDEVGIDVDERPCYCPLVEIKEHTPERTETHACDYGRKETHGDVISRDAVSSWLKQYGQDVLHGKYKISLMYIWKNLLALPSTQPERKKGEWIYGENDGQDGWFCSECDGFIPWDYKFYGLDNIDFIKDFKTCPFCDTKMITYTGADMRGKQK